MRKFEIVSKYNNTKINLPKRASKDSAGYDFEIIERVEIKPGEIKLAPTGLRILMPKNEVLLVFPRSSLAMKKGLMMSNGVGVVDADYYGSENEGHLMIPLYNFTNETVVIEPYERVAQGIFTNFYKTTGDDDNNTIRLGGFGSSGK